MYILEPQFVDIIAKIDGKKSRASLSPVSLMYSLKASKTL